MAMPVVSYARSKQFSNAQILPTRTVLSYRQIEYGNKICKQSIRTTCGCQCTVCQSRARTNHKLLLVSDIQSSGYSFTQIHGQSGRFKSLFYEWFAVRTLRIQHIREPNARGTDKICTSMFPLAANNSTIAQTVVAAAAALRAASLGLLRPDFSTLKDYNMAVRSIRNITQNDQQELLDENTVLALIFLAVPSMTFGLKADLNKHCNGIRSLVYARGGLHNYSGNVAHLILWVDFYNALYQDSRPNFATTNKSIISLKESPFDVYNSAFYNNDFGLSLSVMTSARDVVLLNCLLQEAVYNSTTPSRFNYYMYKRNAARCELQELHATFHKTGTIDECVTYALQAYRLVALTGRFTEIPLIHLCENMMKALQKTELESGWGGGLMQDMLTWCLWCTGGLVTPQWKGGKIWFAQQLRRLLHFKYCVLGSPDWFVEWRMFEAQRLEEFAWAPWELTPFFEDMCDLIEMQSEITS